MSDGRKQPLTADWPKYYRCRTQVEEELMDHLGRKGMNYKAACSLAKFFTAHPKCTRSGLRLLINMALREQDEVRSRTRKPTCSEAAQARQVREKQQREVDERRLG